MIVSRAWSALWWLLACIPASMAYIAVITAVTSLWTIIVIIVSRTTALVECIGVPISIWHRVHIAMGWCI